MLKIKLLGTIFTAVLLSFLVMEVKSINAEQSANNNRSISGPLTSPITGPCKRGWGFGDKNHCHTGPWGLFNKATDNAVNAEVSVKTNIKASPNKPHNK